MAKLEGEESVVDKQRWYFTAHISAQRELQKLLISWARCSPKSMAHLGWYLPDYALILEDWIYIFFPIAEI